MDGFLGILKLKPYSHWYKKTINSYEEYDVKIKQS